MRALRIGLIVLAVLALLAAVGDRVAVRLVQAEAGDRIRQEYGLSESPEIRIKGFPFLTQVLDKRFEEVTVDLSGITADGANGSDLTLARADARLYDLRVQGDRWDRATAARAEGRVRFGYEDISRALPGGVVTVSYGGKDAAGDGLVKATVGATFFGEKVENSALVRISAEGGNTIRLQTVKIEGADVVPGLEELLRSRLDYEWKITDLPRGLRLGAVEITEEGITVTGSGRDVELAP
ncbi:DUF2993 domain-containing protein [Streptomyces polyrhachis]|uniref:DUF2993 domain-containing protein n=1 Tax=Streptomyces polyrhachis TaxID=1282885 RepID=A0ABW2GG97_9ACTN